ncbi:hypothetical protein NAMH_1471 [Nautilia profundicola AmH]|uniref:START domain-containing protein n=1 Tax=Nautilia profundicola (strain ATCC BAA-1463 / DSM 18972 / AmH) TaxID=598659 RepID=B9L675_NAUPA|nr:hypothetical protein [Nautilia profundicola]ACM92457.1 hypothetical protein NAMH_1471 [Nautilia profundicola AmH]
MKKLIFLLLSVAVLFSWELKKNENGIKVYTQNVENSKYDEFKAEMIVTKPFDKVKKTLLDFKNYPKWQKKIENIEVKNGYMLKELDFPFPLSNRFAFYKINIKQTPDMLEIDLNSIPYDKLPENIKKEFEKPSCVEMKDDVVFKAVKTDNGVKIIYSAKVDPKGAPAFIFNRKIVSAAYETLNNLKEELNK